MLIEINDITAPELDVFARLTEAQLRSRLEPEKGVFIAESPKVITTAVENGYRPAQRTIGPRRRRWPGSRTFRPTRRSVRCLRTSRAIR